MSRRPPNDPGFLYRLGQRVEINSQCFMSDWEGIQGIVREQVPWARGIGRSYVIQTDDDRSLAILETSLSLPTAYGYPQPKPQPKESTNA